MTQSELKEKLYDLVAMYFAVLDAEGSIVWGRTKPVKPGSPMVSLALAQVQRPYRPARRYVNGIVLDSYPSSTMFRVELFTKGALTTDEPGVTAQNENTAVNDLSDFANFLGSVHADHWCGRIGIALKVNRVQDLTALTHGSSWQYRALLEIDVGFMQNAAGHTAIGHEGGITLHGNGQPMFDEEGYALDSNGNRLTDEHGQPLPSLPIGQDGRAMYPQAEMTHSGGRSQNLADGFTGWFEQVEIKKKKEAKRYG